MTCATAECSGPGTCPLPQDLCENLGATMQCHTLCGPFQAACPAGLICGDGVCKHAGTAAFGEPCAYHDAVAGCQSGLYCKSAPWPVGSRCKKACNPFAPAPGCDPGERCFFPGYCDPALSSGVSSAAIDSVCTIASPGPGGLASESVPCADDGKAYRGTCASESLTLGGPTVTMCRRFCDPHGPACPSGLHCRASWDVGARCVP